MIKRIECFCYDNEYNGYHVTFTKINVVGFSNSAVAVLVPCCTLIHAVRRVNGHLLSKIIL